MPHLSGVFDEFPDLEKVSATQLLAWMTQKPELHFLVNFLGNRVLYPQAVPLTSKELEIDLAILRAAIKIKPGLFFQPQTNKIIIPRMFAQRFPPIGNIVRAIIEGINPKGVHIIYVKDSNKIKVVGSVISPLNPQKLSMNESTVLFSAGNIKKQIPMNAISIVQLSVADTKVELGPEEYKVIGGEMGVIVDLRLGGFG